MSVTLTRAAADSYFAPTSHVRSDLWTQFGTTQKEGALAHATRQVSLFLGTEVADEDQDTDAYYYPDRAVFEQALYLLLNANNIANGEMTGPKHLSIEPSEADGVRVEVPNIDELCEAAGRFLQRPRKRVMLWRG